MTTTINGNLWQRVRRNDMGADDFFEQGKRFFVEGKYKESIEAFTMAAEAGYEQSISYLSRGAA